MLPAYSPPSAPISRCAPGLRYDDPSACTSVTSTFAAPCLHCRTIRLRSTIDGKSLYLLGKRMDAGFQLLAAPEAAPRVGAGLRNRCARLAANAGIPARVQFQLRNRVLLRIRIDLRHRPVG